MSLASERPAVRRCACPRPPSCCCRSDDLARPRRAGATGPRTRAAIRGAAARGGASCAGRRRPGRETGGCANGSPSPARPTRCRAGPGTRRAPAAARRASAPSVDSCPGSVVLQREVHRERAQQRVLGLPRRRGRPRSSEVLERRRRERREAGGDALGVGAQQRRAPRPAAPRARGAATARRRSTRTSRSAASAAVPNELGQLARRAPAQQVHLEEALLRVQEARGPRDVDAAPPAHHRERRARRARCAPERRSPASARSPSSCGQAGVEPLARAVGACPPRARAPSGDAADDERPAPARRALERRRHRRDACVPHLRDWFATASAALLRRLGVAEVVAADRPAARRRARRPAGSRSGC